MIKPLQNKPRVFLSHSKKDKEFIHKLCKDLRSCQIEPWLDSQEIRHGQPWLDAIFESGIPTCDAILVYLTENSVESAMVKKEIDASMIKKLKESHVAFLPYVSQKDIRDKLRMDIQALQAPVWNIGNYSEMLPRVVAEIWHSYLDSVVMLVANEEKVRRLEAELELEKLKKTGIESIFEAREIADFDFIWKQFKYEDIIKFIYEEFSKVEGQEHVSYKSVYVQIQTIIPLIDRISGGSWDFPQKKVINIFKDVLKICFPDIIDENTTYPYIWGDARIDLEWENLPIFMDKLKMYGLIKISQNREYESIMLTEKADRFRYWLKWKGILPNEIKWRNV
jgi:hypothetical protein